jgi:hypothetical protein
MTESMADLKKNPIGLIEGKKACRRLAQAFPVVSPQA